MRKNPTYPAYVLLLIFLFFTTNSVAQVGGDFQAKTSGNWSDYNSWNYFNGGWIAASPGQIPTATSNVYIPSPDIINVDDQNATCNNIYFTGASSGKIAFTTSASVLNIKGNMALYSTGHDCFGSWASGAKIVFSGTGTQSVSNLSTTTTPNSAFQKIEINKASGSFITATNFLFTDWILTSGDVIIGTANQLLGTLSNATITVNGGTWTQNDKATRINGGASGTPIGTVTVKNGKMNLATSSTGAGNGFQFSEIHVMNGGVLNFQYFTGTIAISAKITVDATSIFNTALALTPLPPVVDFGGKVIYNRNGPQTISAAIYNYLKLDSTGVKTLGSGTTSISSNGTLEMSGMATSPTLSLGSGTLLVSSTATNLIYSSSGSQTATSNEWDPNFQNVTINNPSDVNMIDGLSRSITGSLNLTNGTLGIGTGTTTTTSLALNGAPLNRTNGYINGTSKSDLSITGTTGGTVALPLSGDIKLQNVTVSGTRTLVMNGTNNINLYGTFDIGPLATYDNGGDSEIDRGSSATPVINIYGRFITRDVQGFYANHAAIDDGITALTDLNNSTIEYALAGNQAVQGATLPSYYNVTFSGSGTKALISDNQPTGTITISGAAIFNAANHTFGSTVANLTMTGTSKYINGGSGTKPDAGGNYNLGINTTIEFGLTSGTIIRLGTGPAYYANIIISGSNVSNGSSITGIPFQSGGTFTVKSGATFGLKNTTGFSGLTSTAISSNNNPVITLETGSTIEYVGAGQTITNQIPYQNLSLAGSGNETAPSGILSVFGNLSKSGNGVFVHNNGTVLLNGAGTQSFAGLTYYDLLLANGTKVTSGSSTIIDSIKINDGTTLSISGTPDSIFLHSDANRTARVGRIGTGIINYNTSGKFVAERYIPARKAWRFLSVPVKPSQFIKDAWQEGAADISQDPKPHYGTIITSNIASWSSAGFDEPSLAPSIKTYNPSTNDYTGITSVKVRFDPSLGGYMTFIRGDRTATAFNSPVTSTTLRTTGQLFTGTQPTVYTISNNGQFTPVNNPYASQIDMRQLSKNVVYYVWDPKRSDNYGYGAFTTFAWNPASGDFDATPVYAGSSYTNSANNFIDNGQAFFVSTIGSTTTFQFTENVKTDTALAVSPFTPVTSPGQRLRSDLYVAARDGDFHLIDGVLNNYGDNYSDGIDGLDAKKYINASENLSIYRHNTLLAIERRSTLHVQDTIFFRLSNIKAKETYRFIFTPNKIDISGLQSYLVDNYLNQKIPLKTDTTRVNFTTDGTAGSADAARFYVVFDVAEDLLAVIFSSAKADRQNENIAVEWTTENESDVISYEVQRSRDGIAFSPVVIMKAKSNPLGNEYAWLDTQPAAGYNYYRIKSISIKGEVKYSAIMKVFTQPRKSFISVYPNPVKDGIIQLQLISQPAGNYTISAISSSGALIETQQFNYPGSSGAIIFKTKALLAPGVYLLRVKKPDGSEERLDILK